MSALRYLCIGALGFWVFDTASPAYGGSAFTPDIARGHAALGLGRAAGGAACCYVSDDAPLRKNPATSRKGLPPTAENVDHLKSEKKDLYAGEQDAGSSGSTPFTSSRLCMAPFSAVRSFGELFAEQAPKTWLEIKPDFSWNLYYEDNIAGTERDKIDDFSNRYEPAVEATLTADRLSLVASSELEIIEYIDERDWNSVDQIHLATLSYAFSRRTNAFITAGYSVETDPDRLYKRDEIDLTLGEYVVLRSKDKTKSFLTGFNHGLSRRLNCTGQFTFLNFETAATDDSDYYLGNVVARYDVTQKTSLKVIGRYSFFDYTFGGSGDVIDDFIEEIVAGDSFELFTGSDFTIDTYNLSVGAFHAFNETMTLDAQIGWRYTEVDSTIQTTNTETGETTENNEKNDGDGITFTFEFEKRFPDLLLRLKGDRNVGTSPNTGQTYEHTNFWLFFDYEIMTRLKAKAMCRYYLHEADKGEELGYEIDREIFSFTYRFIYKYSHQVDFVLGYRFNRSKDNIRSSDRKRNTVFLEVNYRTLKPFIIE